MVFFDWSDDLSVNIAEIDAQHMRLVEMLNELYENMTNEHRTAVLGKVLTGMVEYAKTHFATEERYMTKYDFPGYAEHKAEHEDFLAKADDLLDRYANDPTLLSVETGRFLREWLDQHITGTDKLYGPFLNDKGVY
jgi:hemerythrin